jgi:chemotaxis protein methyltransferase CheR
MSRALTAQDRVGIQAEMTKRTGLSFAGSRGPHLSNIVERMFGCEPDSARGAPVPRTADEAAFDRLCDALTVQESFFFREASRLALIREHVLPWVRERRPHLRVWSAGCARGEEAYTLSMLLNDAGLRGGFEVLGTDLSAKAVASAERGAYGRWAVRGLDQKAVAAYFDSGPGGLRVADRFRTRVTFEQHNLFDPLPSGWGRFDLILCRNVLIYFTPEAVRRAGEALTAALAPGGWLLLGVSDPPLDDVAGLEKVSTEHGTAYRRQDAPPDAAPSEKVIPVGVFDVPARTLAVTAPGPSPAPARTTPASALEAGSPDLVAAGENALALADTGSAVNLARQALDSSPEEPEVHRLMIQALAEDGRTRESLAAAARAVSLFPEDPRIREFQSAVLLETGQVAPAMVAARQAVYLDPGSALAHVVLARTHELLGDAGAAQRARRNARIPGVAPVEP